MKRITWILLCSLIVSVIGPVGTAMASPVEGLATVENMLYGQQQGGALVSRLERLERDLFGETKSGALIVRINNINQYLLSSEVRGASLTMQLNALEWMVHESVNDGQPIAKRLEALEMALYGAPQEGAIMERSSSLIKVLWATDDLKTRSVELPKETLVKIRLQTELNSAKNEVGQRVRYRIVDDVLVDGIMVLPAGSEGEGKVTEVTSAGRLGRDGRVVVDFSSVKAIDGTPVQLEVSERATEKNLSLEMAAGASMAGVILLGPIGLAGGYFVKGKDVSIPVGTEFYVEVSRGARVTGLDLRP
ncbi:MAG: hypothetical protein ACOYD6_04100 [Limnochordia bacterium]|jgi:hypothetical protein